MKVSKYIKIDENIIFKKIHLARIKYNKCNPDLYLLCTSTCDNNLFEIIEGKYLTKEYKECYLVGLAGDKCTAIEYLGEFIDQIYNIQELEYERLKV